MTIDKTQTIGFIGLGEMGGGIADRLLRSGWRLRVLDTRAEVVAPLAQLGARPAESVAEIGRDCVMVGICVKNDAQVREVIEGEGGLLSTLRSGRLIAVHSTIHPDTVAALHASAVKKSLRLLDAPVSGGRRGALAGTLAVMCGGSKEDFELAKPVLDAFGGLVGLLGPVGSGSRVKLINNNLVFSHMGLGLHALDLAERLGMDREQTAKMILAASGFSTGFQTITRLIEQHGGPSPKNSMDKDHGHFVDLLRQNNIEGDQLEKVASWGLQRIKALRRT